MSDSWDGAAPTRDEDAVETDAHAESSAEELDEDRLRLDPLEAGVGPPPRGGGVDKYGMTPYEQAHPRGLTDRLAEEEPDVQDTSDLDVSGQAEPRSEQADDVTELPVPGDPTDDAGIDAEALRESRDRGQLADD